LCDSLNFQPFMKRSAQRILISGLKKYSDSITSIAQKCVDGIWKRISLERAVQLVSCVLYQHSFGLNMSNLHTVLNSPHLSHVHDYISGFTGKFPGGSTLIRRVPQITSFLSEELADLVQNVQDYFYCELGTRARNQYKKQILGSKKSVSPPFECFVGLLAPSKVFPTLEVVERGKLMPFFNAMMYVEVKRISSTMELVGEIKEPDWDGEDSVFRLAGMLGFVAGPPGKKKFYDNFSWIEALIGDFNEFLNSQLTAFHVVDLTVTSVDTSNVPMDKRDTTGSKGTGSRGTFFGHKTSIGADSKCIPLTQELETGRVHDALLFPATLDAMNELALDSDQQIWFVEADAGYSTAPVVDAITQVEAIPFVDLNPKNSSRLRDLKNASNDLREYSKKAIKNGLTKSERRAWLEEVREISRSSDHPLTIDEKCAAVKKTLRKYAERAKRKGLNHNERRTEKKLRKRVMNLRRELRLHGTTSEKKRGLMLFGFGTIEWQLIYSIRGQNEGINGIIKKRGNVIGDGQHTSWIRGNRTVKNRLNAKIAMMKAISLVYFLTTGQTNHALRVYYNWRFNNQSFMLFFIVIYCR